MPERYFPPQIPKISMAILSSLFILQTEIFPEIGFEKSHGIFPQKKKLIKKNSEELKKK